MAKNKPRVLVVDDDEFFVSYAADVLADLGGYEVVQARGVDEAIDLAHQNNFKVVVTDLKMKPGSRLGVVPTGGGHYTGIALAREIRKSLPNAKIIIHTSQGGVDLSFLPPPAKGVTYQYKTRDPQEFLRSVSQLLEAHHSRPRAFIVHGSDHKAAWELKNYLQNRLGFAEPTILMEQPNIGKTVIEKLEFYAGNSDVAFVLLTPDDTGRPVGDADEVRFRARQNVIFELGYFLGIRRRSTGRVVVLHKGALEIPSDIAGVVYIDISHGIDAAGEHIRREVEAWP